MRRRIPAFILAVLMTLTAIVVVPVGAETSGDWQYTVSNNEATITRYTGTATDVVIPGEIDGYTVTGIAEWAFEESNLTSVTIPDCVTVIGQGAFYNCQSLANITIPESVVTIEYGAFYNCRSLTSITIPESVTTLGDSAFSSCRGLTSVTLSGNVTSFGNFVFGQCFAVKVVIISDSVTKIGAFSFYNSSIIETVYYEGSQSDWNNLSVLEGNDPLLNAQKVFDYSANHVHSYVAEVTPASCTEDGLTTYTCSVCGDSYTETIPATGHTFVNEVCSACGASAFQYTIANDVATLTKYIGNSTVVEIPATLGDCPVTAIGEYAFASNSTLTGVSIPDSVTNIKKNAFSNCSSISSIVIPESVRTLGEKAFSSCRALTSVTLSGNVTSFGNYVFYLCTGVTTAYISDSVTKIGKYAFTSCTALETVYYSGSESAWNSVSVLEGNNPILNAQKVFNYSGTHTHSYTAVVTAPTCTAGGYTTYTCSCGDSYTANETAALGHNFVNGVCTACGEADIIGGEIIYSDNFDGDDFNYYNHTTGEGFWFTNPTTGASGMGRFEIEDGKMIGSGDAKYAFSQYWSGSQDGLYADQYPCMDEFTEWFDVKLDSDGNADTYSFGIVLSDTADLARGYTPTEDKYYAAFYAQDAAEPDGDGNPHTGFARLMYNTSRKIKNMEVYSQYTSGSYTFSNYILGTYDIPGLDGFNISGDAVRIGVRFGRGNITMYANGKIVASYDRETIGTKTTPVVWIDNNNCYVEMDNYRLGTYDCNVKRATRLDSYELREGTVTVKTEEGEILQTLNYTEDDLVSIDPALTSGGWTMMIGDHVVTNAEKDALYYGITLSELDAASLSFTMPDENVIITVIPGAADPIGGEILYSDNFDGDDFNRDFWGSVGVFGVNDGKMYGWEDAVIAQSRFTWQESGVSTTADFPCQNEFTEWIDINVAAGANSNSYSAGFWLMDGSDVVNGYLSDRTVYNLMYYAMNETGDGSAEYGFVELNADSPRNDSRAEKPYGNHIYGRMYLPEYSENCFNLSGEPVRIGLRYGKGNITAYANGKIVGSYNYESIGLTYTPILLQNYNCYVEFDNYRLGTYDCNVKRATRLDSYELRNGTVTVMSENGDVIQTLSYTEDDLVSIDTALTSCGWTMMIGDHVVTDAEKDALYYGITLSDLESDFLSFTMPDEDVTIILSASAEHSHTPAQPVRENVIASTCTAAGSYDIVTYCSVCGEVISTETYFVSALGHDFVNGICTACGAADPDYVAPTPLDPSAPKLVVSDARAKAGDQITMTVSLENNPGVAGLDFRIIYDTSVLTLDSVTNAGLFSGFSSGRNIIIDENGDVTEDGAVVTLTFTVASDAAAGDYTVGVKLRGATNYDLDDVDLAIVSGTLTVYSFMYGDVNEDGEISNKDIILLRRFLSNYDEETGLSNVTVGQGADANGDGEITIKDVTLLRRYLSNYDEETGTSTETLGPKN